jgi:hypothetical protein
MLVPDHGAGLFQHLAGTGMVNFDAHVPQDVERRPLDLPDLIIAQHPQEHLPLLNRSRI